MSEQDRKDFDDRLAELNNWQIEQQKKLKAFQEAQKKLLDMEHQNVLSGLSTHSFGQRHNRCNEETSKSVFKKYDTETSLGLKNFNTKEANGIFQLKFPQLRLTEPKSSLISKQNHSSQTDITDNFCSESIGDLEESRTNKPRKFLKRGEGLARFRMTLDDFKGPPKIYREKRIKTYINNNPEYKKKTNIKSLKNNNKCNKISAPKMAVKSAPFPVKIYVPENKTSQCTSAKSSESKNVLQNNKKLSLFCPKNPIENLALKPHNIATEWYNALKEKEKAAFKTENLDDEINSVVESDIENKKDEKELRIFEILEKKVDDTSFCSTSSFVDKLMEQSMSSTPSKPFTKNQSLCKSYAQGLKSLCSQFLNEEQMRRFEELDKIPFEKDVRLEEHECKNGSSDKEIPIPTISVIDEEIEDKSISEKIDVNQPLEHEAEIPKESESELPKEHESPTHKVNKTQLQEYIKDFKKFKFLLAENVHRIEEEPEAEPSPKELLKEEKQERPNPHEIALKLQRKGLQDNVKQLLNWECPSRKRPTKRVVKKIKPKPRLEKSKAANKEQSEKIIFSSSLLHERLNELEKEIEIFRKENKNLERLQKEFNEERAKLSKERKEFEKQMQEEKEKLEAQIIEEQKKLQKEKMVFEKYCKQVKNQPTRQEREETAKLKKEIEKLTEALTTKEARWGASQARLRNQIKNFERENSHLKAEVEKYKKLSSKKVSFENERNLNTKIIHVINSELGKLKPTVIRNTKSSGSFRNPSLSARVERDVCDKPIRRIKSAPNVKKQVEVDLCTENFNECDEKALGSVSTDSGIETNGSRYMTAQKGHNSGFYDSKASKEVGTQNLQRENSCRSPLLGHLGECTAGKKAGDSTIQSVVCEAIFEDDINTSRKIAEVKNRLERLSLLGHSEEVLENQPVKMVTLHSNIRDSETDEGSCISGEDEEEYEDKENDLEITDCSFKKRMPSKNDPCSGFYPYKNLIESKLDENGIWEKFFEDGSKEISYPNGNVKKIFPGSKIVRMTYYNGDIKETNVAEGSEKYYYAETKTWHTTYKDGLEVLEFPNGQTERRHADGSTEISFSNGCIRYCDPSGRDEWRFLDGTVIKTNECGHKILLMPNGQKEIHTKEFKRREYPDGTVKILYSDGTQETRYSNGRVRLKDKDGNLVMDSGGIRFHRTQKCLDSYFNLNNYNNALGHQTGPNFGKETCRNTCTLHWRRA